MNSSFTEREKMKIKLTKKESHFVTRELLNDYVGQSDKLPVTFKCKDGIIKCSGRLLMLSDFWSDMIGGVIKFANPIEFDFSVKTPTKKCYPKQVIKSYLDYIHLAATDDVDLLSLLLLLDFLNSEGRQKSEFEQEIATRVCNDLIQMQYDMETQLMILQFMKNFDSSKEDAVDKTKPTTLQQFSSHVKKHLTQQSLAGTIINVNEKCDLDAVSDYMFGNKLFDNVPTSEVERRSFALLRAGKELLGEKIETEDVAFGCGKNDIRQLGVDGGNVIKPVQSDFDAIEFIDANFATCTIDSDGHLAINGKREARMKGPVKLATTGARGGIFAVDSKGQIWSRGSNSYGELGHGDTTVRNEPTLIEALKGKQTKQISAHCFSVACTTIDNDAYVWGCSTTFGLDKTVTTPTKLHRKIKHIETGMKFALMLDEANKVFAIGDNLNGCLGVGDEINRGTWTKVNGFDGETVIKIQAGSNCSAILTNKGLYAMGHHLFGAANNKKNKPTKITLPNVINVSLSFAHIFALTKDAKLFAWGWNHHGQCGVDSKKAHIEVPTRVALPENCKVNDFSAGFYHSMIKCTGANLIADEAVEPVSKKAKKGLAP